MEVKPGFKQTEIGVLPEDWEVRFLLQVCNFRGGKAHEPFVSEYGDYVCVNSKFISSDGKIQKKCTINLCPGRTDDILMVMSDLPNGKALAKAFVVDKDEHYAVNQRICALSPYASDSRYLYFVLNRMPYFLSFDDGVSQTHLLNPVFQKCRIPLPPIKEQTKIANTLSDIDFLIKSFEKQIEKKKNIKQGVMQELLTGKRRLPGFSGEWETTIIETCCHILKGRGLSKSQLTSDGLHECILYGELFTTYNDVIEEIYSYSDSTDGVESITGDILLPGSTTTTGIDLAKASALLKDGVRLGGDINILRPKKKLDSSFFAMYLNVVKRYAIAEKTKGITIHHLHGNDIKNIIIELPSLSEQIAISNIIKTANEEIYSLENQLSKYRLIKQGMMQELLTGRIRLI